MRVVIVLVLVCATLAAAKPNIRADDDLQLAEPCDAVKCKLPSCRCAGTDIPGGLSLKETPQFVTLNFNGPVTVSNIYFYEHSFTGRNNRDGCPVAATFFHNHEYCDYKLINNLYYEGHEIALLSITHKDDVEYWKQASMQTLISEYVGQRDLVANFANIPKEEITGIRLPYLQLSGNTSFEVIEKFGFAYDCSWPTRQYMAEPATNQGALWPYTLDYKSIQDCDIYPCPTASLPGVWVAPMPDWMDQGRAACNMVDTCINVPRTANELKDWMIENFNRHYKTNKAPFGFPVHASWLAASDARYEAFNMFIDYLLTLEDVRLVGVKKVLEWVKNPVPLSQLDASSWSKSCRKYQKSDCNGHVCELTSPGKGTYWMNTCVSRCPNSYPWLGNPLGE